MMKILIYFSVLLLINCRSASPVILTNEVLTGADQTELYIPILKGKAVGLVANHTSLVGKTHLADTLLALGIDLVRIFAPEHGFRGSAGAGDVIKDTIDSLTGRPVISLYGSSLKPKIEDLQGLDIMIYDIQDVGVRFYTYISTMHYVMEACAEQGIPVVLLDRPNPLGHYVAGPLLDTAYRSFVGMHPIPVVYGMTAGELARMINEEGWLRGGNRCKLQVIPCSFYDHNTFYTLPVNPSPNLNSMEAVYLYPSVCFFEGTIMSLGRGTPYPFRVIGHPDYPLNSFSFVPQANESNLNPLFLNISCYGINLTSLKIDTLRKINDINLDWMIGVYSEMKKGRLFFTDYIDRLAGSDNLRKMILKGATAVEIRNSWQPELDNFKAVRQKYLLYKDFD
jgi:uncharacterized protein YbbC (DUF1343 family)